MEGKEEFLYEGFREWKNGDEAGQDFPFTVLSLPAQAANSVSRCPQTREMWRNKTANYKKSGYFKSPYLGNKFRAKIRTFHRKKKNAKLRSV